MVLWGPETSFLPLLQGSFLPPQAPEPHLSCPTCTPLQGGSEPLGGWGGGLALVAEPGEDEDSGL